jgi:hypothetical protein
VNQGSALTANFGNYRYWDMPFATSLSAGNYFAAIQRSSTSAGSAFNFGISALMVTQHNSSIAFFNQASSSSNQLVPYLGIWSTNSSGGTSSSIARSGVSTAASHPIPIFQLHREA